MFNDILGQEEDEMKIEDDKDSIIDSLKYNLEEKEKMIEDLIRQVTDLERIVEDIGTNG